jgi:hypothetical protein
MKLFKILLTLIVTFYFLTSCQKTIDTNQTAPNEITIAEKIRNGIDANSRAFVADESGYSNYFYIKFSQLANKINRDSSYDIEAYANFNHTDIGPVSINNNIDMLPDENNLYHYRFPLNAGLALMGTSLPVDAAEPINPNDTINASRVRQRTIMVVPTQIYPLSVSFPASVIDRMAVLPLTWSPDPNNQFGKVQIDVIYNSAISQHNATGMPNSVAKLSYQVTDNGSFSIPASDLNRFPRDSYVSISIVRVWSVTSANNVVYVAFVEGRTVPLLVVSSGPLVVDFTTSTNPYPNQYSTRMTAVVNGGIPPFTYEWRKRGYFSTVWGNIFSTSNFTNYSGDCIPRSTGVSAYFQLKVTDNLGNSSITEKLVGHRCDPR